MQPRHRRSRRLDLPALAERAWRPPLAGAVLLFVLAGPAHARGHTDLVYFLVLVALTASGIAVPLGLLGLRRRPKPATGPQRVAPPAEQS